MRNPRPRYRSEPKRRVIVVAGLEPPGRALPPGSSPKPRGGCPADRGLRLDQARRRGDADGPEHVSIRQRVLRLLFLAPMMLPTLAPAAFRTVMGAVPPG